MQDGNSVDHAIHLLRRQRHSFLNHLQVISGWLQLDRPERARQYLETVAGRMAGESDVVRQVPGPVGLMVLELGLEAETHGVELTWLAGEHAGELSPEAMADLRRQVLEALAAASQQADGARRVTVRLGPGAFAVHTAFGKGEG